MVQCTHLCISSPFLHAFTSAVYLPALKWWVSLLAAYNFISEFLQVMWDSPESQSRGI